MAKKKKAQHNRGFATTSVPSKKVAPIPEEKPEEPSADQAPDAAESQTVQIEIEDEVLKTNAAVVENGNKAVSKLWNEVEPERRSRKGCVNVSISESVISKILNLCRSQLCTRSKSSNNDEEAELTRLYTAELILKRMGIRQDISEKVLEECDLESWDQILEYVS